MAVLRPLYYARIAVRRSLMSVILGIMLLNKTLDCG